MEEQFKAWMPVIKSKDGSFVGILSDDSIDRDEEFMTKELLESWAKNTSLKALANHENKMEKWVGGWSELKVIEKNGKTALVAKPWFFSKDANPLAAQIQKQVEEALEHGENAGISIGAIPKESCDKMVSGKKKKGYVKAELLEATWVPIQSNRNASYGHIAKQFELEEITKQNQVEDCVKEITADKEIVEINKEENKMESDSKMESCIKQHMDAGKSKEEAMQMCKLSEVELKKEEKVEIKKEEVFDVLVELKEAKSKIEALEKELAELKSKGILKATVEQSPLLKKQDEKEFSVFGVLKQKLKN